ncbi:MAG: RluA family pseudouridine synthase [Gemmatimonadota bacterium]|jgi:23S rRNA pseudouridine1911/1915/1917 synthase|nr:RluA family pseudouridine synthase [Gemmatimonadota bacterium]
MSSEPRVVEVTAEEAGRRLDVFVAEGFGVSRSRAEQLIEDGQVLVNGERWKKRDRPVPGDRVSVWLPSPEPSTVEPQAIPLDIVYQDEDLLVLNKPAGLVVHPAPGNRSGTLVNALLHAVEDLSGIGGVLRPGIVHRLDRDTSGLMVVAKNDIAHQRLSDALKRREVRRGYLAAAWGHLSADALTVDAPIARSTTDRKRMAVVEGGRRALTRFRLVERWRAADLISAQLETGRTHQIRVHLRHIGHPVVGDETYGRGAERGISGSAHPWAVAFARRVRRQFLHAAELAFEHPRTGEAMRFEAPLPEELALAAQWAREKSM